MHCLGSICLLLERTGFRFQHNKADIIRCRVTCRRKCGGMACEIQILIIFRGFLMCWSEPGCGPSQSPQSHPCPEVRDGESWKELDWGSWLDWEKLFPPESGRCPSRISHGWFRPSFLPRLGSLLLRPFAEPWLASLLNGCDECSLEAASSLPHPHSLPCSQLPPGLSRMSGAGVGKDLSL